jgi:hypothetical protein
MECFLFKINHKSESMLGTGDCGIASTSQHKGTRVSYGEYKQELQTI